MNIEIRPTFTAGYFDVILNRWVIACVKPDHRTNPDKDGFSVRLTGLPIGEHEPCELVCFTSKESASAAAIETFKKRIKDTVK